MAVLGVMTHMGEVVNSVWRIQEVMLESRAGLKMEAEMYREPL